jgi:hypothetical protein
LITKHTTTDAEVNPSLRHGAREKKINDRIRHSAADATMIRGTGRLCRGIRPARGPQSRTIGRGLHDTEALIMASGPSPLPNSTPPHFQFTLRQLMAATAVACVLAALCYWLGPGLGLFSIVPLGSWACSAFFLTRSRFSEAFFAILFGVAFTCLLLPAAQGPRINSRSASCNTNLRYLALALHQYHDTYGSFPPAYIADADGKPMHSWRILLLPYIDQRNLYKQYRFDEPWDGPNNIALVNGPSWPRLYGCPSSNWNGETNYVAVVGPQTIWPGTNTTKISDIKDGTPNTILLVEVHNSGIHWMEPRDLDISQMNMSVNPPTGTGISSAHPGGRSNIALANGETRSIDSTAPPKALRAALTIAGGEKDILPAKRAP